MNKILSKITLLFCVVLFLVIVSSFYQVHILFDTRGSAWETVTIVDGEEFVIVENIWNYVLSLILIAILFLVLLTNYLLIKDLQEKLDTVDFFKVSGVEIVGFNETED